MAIGPLTQDDVINLILIAGYTVAILVLWRMPYVHWVLYPFKLVTIAFHEFGHAAAALCTCGTVESIQVDPDLGGVTLMRGGIGWITLPAGYLGSSLFGAAMIFSGFDLLASKICSIFIMLALLATLYWAKNWLLRILTVLFVAFIAFLWWPAGGVGLRYVVLFMGCVPPARCAVGGGAAARRVLTAAFAADHHARGPTSVMSALYSVWDILEVCQRASPPHAWSAHAY